MAELVFDIAANDKASPVFDNVTEAACRAATAIADLNAALNALRCIAAVDVKITSRSDTDAA